MTEPSVGYLAGVASVSGSTAVVLAQVVRRAVEEQLRADGVGRPRADVAEYLGALERAAAFHRLRSSVHESEVEPNSKAMVQSSVDGSGDMVTAVEVGRMLDLTPTRVRQLAGVPGGLQPVRRSPYLFARADVEALRARRAG